MLSSLRRYVILRACAIVVPLRNSSSSCWKCGTAIKDNNTIFCPSSDCEAIQPIDLSSNDIDLFGLFGLTAKIDVNVRELESSFKSLQGKLHPDKFATKSLPERNASNTTSSAINQAYQVF